MGALVLMGGRGLEKIRRWGHPHAPPPPTPHTHTHTTMENHKYCSETLGMFLGNFSVWSSVLDIFLVNFLF